MHIVRFSLLFFAAAFLVPLAAHAAWWVSHDDAVAWHRADWSSAGILPPARAKPGAAVYVFAARTGRWKGIFAHHSWIVVKERGATSYTRFDKVALGPAGQDQQLGPGRPLVRPYANAGCRHRRAARRAAGCENKGGSGTLSPQSARRLLCLAGAELQQLHRVCARGNSRGRHRPAAHRHRQGLARRCAGRRLDTERHGHSAIARRPVRHQRWLG